MRKISYKGLRKKAWNLQSQFIRRKEAGYGDKLFGGCLRSDYCNNVLVGLVNCYTCGKTNHWKEMDVAHYIHKDCLDFEPDNLRVCCARCNRFLHGNLGVFAEKLIKEIGQERVDRLRELSHRVKKFTRQELERIIEKYRGGEE